MKNKQIKLKMINLSSDVIGISFPNQHQNQKIDPLFKCLPKSSKRLKFNYKQSISKMVSKKNEAKKKEGQMSKTGEQFYISKKAFLARNQKNSKRQKITLNKWGTGSLKNCQIYHPHQQHRTEKTCRHSSVSQRYNFDFDSQILKDSSVPLLQHSSASKYQYNEQGNEIINPEAFASLNVDNKSSSQINANHQLSPNRIAKEGRYIDPYTKKEYVYSLNQKRDYETFLSSRIRQNFGKNITQSYKVKSIHLSNPEDKCNIKKRKLNISYLNEYFVDTNTQNLHQKLKQDQSSNSKQTIEISNGRGYKTKRKQLMSAHIQKSIVFKSGNMDPDPWQTNSQKSAKHEADCFQK